MGEIAEMMLDGTLCACCGDYIGDDDGFPMYCDECAPHFQPEPVKPAQKTACNQCGKRVKLAGLADHQRDVHGLKGEAA
jgi:hypothetical protein